MSSRFLPEVLIDNSRVERKVSNKAYGWLVTIAVVGAITVTGFIIGASRQCMAISYGYKTESLRLQEQELEAKLRQLELQWAREASPVELEKRARRIGMERPNIKGNSIRRPIVAMK